MSGSAFLTGFVFSAALIAAIGAQNAFVLRQCLRGEHEAAVVLFCIVADAVLVTAGVIGMAGVLRNAPDLRLALTVAGGAFLAGYGLLMLRRARRPRALQTAQGGGTAARMSTFLNPYPYATAGVVAEAGEQAHAR